MLVVHSLFAHNAQCLKIKKSSHYRINVPIKIVMNTYTFLDLLQPLELYHFFSLGIVILSTSFDPYICFKLKI